MLSLPILTGSKGGGRDLARQRRNGRPVQLFRQKPARVPTPAPVSRNRVREEHGDLDPPVDDGVSRPADRRERKKRELEPTEAACERPPGFLRRVRLGAGELPEAFEPGRAAAHEEKAPVFLRDRRGKRNADGRRPRPPAREPLGVAPAPGFTVACERTFRARGPPRGTDQLAQVHERGGDVSAAPRGEKLP